MSGIAMSLTAPFGGVGETVPSVIFGVALIVVTLLGLARARARQFERHREWMVRSFALCLGPVAIRLLAPIFVYGLGMPERAAIVPSFWAGWLVNLALAEVWIRRRQRRIDRATLAHPT
jgi:xanthine/uracil permease